MCVQLMHAVLMGRNTPVPFTMLAGEAAGTIQDVLAYWLPFWSWM